MRFRDVIPRLYLLILYKKVYAHSPEPKSRRENFFKKKVLKNDKKRGITSRR